MSLRYAFHTDYNADSVECCPIPGLEDIIAIGTYELNEASQSRVGRLYLHRLHASRDKAPPQPLPATAPALSTVEGGQEATDSQAEQADASQGATGQWYLQQEATCDVPGIFDLKWSHEPCTSGAESGACTAVLGAALADGTVRTYRVARQAASDSRQEVVLQEVGCCEAITEGGMALSLDWQTDTGASGSSQRIAVSGSSGTASVLQYREDRLACLSEWSAHDLEVWCAAFSRNQPDLVFTGSDDATFKVWDTRCVRQAASEGHTHTDTDIPTDTPTCVWCDRKTYSAGVCTVSPHPTLSHVVVTGSYDERVRVWDVRNPTRPVSVTEVCTHGGNWRLRWHPSHPHLLLAACMYSGFAVLQTSADYSTIECVETYKGHDSIAYGADWCRDTTHAGSTGSTHGTVGSTGRSGIAITCSFYDKLVHVWTPETLAGSVCK